MLCSSAELISLKMHLNASSKYFVDLANIGNLSSTVFIEDVASDLFFFSFLLYFMMLRSRFCVHISCA